MPYVSPLAKSDAPSDAQGTLDAIEKKFGKILNIFGTMARQPGVLDGVATIDAGLADALPDKFREIAYFRTSVINQCEYCSHYHSQAARKAGVTQDQIDALTSDAASQLFDEQEQAVIAYAEQLTRTSRVDPALVERLRTFLNDDQIVGLASTVALANFTNRFNNGLDIELP